MITHENKKREEPVILQEAVSSIESLRWVISDMSWDYGVGNFFQNGIPFSYTTSKTFGKNILECLKLLESTEANLSIVECGAGIGLLGRNTLDVIQKEDKKIYDRLTYHISEYSEEMIDQMNALNIYQEHQDKVHLFQDDFLNSKIDLNSNLTILTYVWDSLPSRHIVVKDGEIYEVLVETHLGVNHSVLDTTKGSPHFLSEEEIKRGVANPEKLRKISRRLIPFLKEAYHLNPINKTKMQRKERTALDAFVADNPSDKAISFNYNFAFEKAIRQCIENLTEGHGILIFDFGHTKDYTNKSWVTPYGSVCFYACCFTHLEWIVSQYDVTLYQTVTPEGSSRAFLIHKQDYSPLREEQFKRIFERKKEAQWAVERDRIRRTAFKTSTELSSRLDQLNGYVQYEYSLLYNLSAYYIEKGHAELALTCAIKLDKEYGQISSDVQYILGKIYHLKGQNDKAVQRYNRALEYDKYHVFSQKELAKIYLEQKDYKHYLKSMKCYLDSLGTFKKTDWEEYLLWVMLNALYGNKTQAKKDLRWLSSKRKKRVPAEIQKKAKAVMYEIEQHG